MKKLILYSALSVVIFQAQAQFRVGEFGAKNYQVKKFGMGLTAEYFLKEKLSVSADILFYYNPVKEVQSSVTINSFDMNTNLNFYFLEQGKLKPYALGGINLHLHRRINHQDPGNPEDDFYTTNDFSVGINTGIGLLWTYKIFHPFIEFDYAPYYFVNELIYDNFTIKIGFKVTIKNKE